MLAKDSTSLSSHLYSLLKQDKSIGLLKDVDIRVNVNVCDGFNDVEVNVNSEGLEDGEEHEGEGKKKEEEEKEIVTEVVGTIEKDSLNLSAPSTPRQSSKEVPIKLKATKQIAPVNNNDNESVSSKSTTSNPQPPPSVPPGTKAR